MSRKALIEERIRAALSPTELEVIDESHLHGGPRPANGGSRESHYLVRVVTPSFEGLARVARHRRIHELLQSELAAGLHALTLDLATPDEQAQKGGKQLESPACLGGSKADTSPAR